MYLLASFLQERDQGQAQEVQRRSICTVREKKQAVKKEKSAFSFSTRREETKRATTKNRNKGEPLVFLSFASVYPCACFLSFFLVGSSGSK